MLPFPMIMKENMTLDECLVFVEGISKELKEMGQREMWKLYSDVLYRLNEYLTKKWASKKITKENLLKKREEQKRFAELKGWFERYKPDEATRKWYLEKLKKYPNYPIQTKMIELTSDDVVPGETDPYTMSILYKRNFSFSFLKDAGRFVNGFTFDKSDISKIEPLIWKFVILHEEGHLYDFAKKYIETGLPPILDAVGTEQALFGTDEEYEKGMESEGSANNQALKNMYRKDRREFLNQTTTKKEDIESIKKTKARWAKQIYLGKVKI